MAKSKDEAARKRPKITIVECDDLTEQEAGAYGQLYVAKVGDWTSDRRSTEARARAEAEAHIDALLAAEDG